MLPAHYNYPRFWVVAASSYWLPEGNSKGEAAAWRSESALCLVIGAHLVALLRFHCSPTPVFFIFLLAHPLRSLLYGYELIYYILCFYIFRKINYIILASFTLQAVLFQHFMRLYFFIFKKKIGKKTIEICRYFLFRSLSIQSFLPYDLATLSSQYHFFFAYALHAL